MKIQLISDVHCEMHNDDGKKELNEIPVFGDVLVVAGDLACHTYLVKSLSILCERFPEVVFVPGNHEYYGSDRGTVNRDLEKLKRRFKNFHSLNNGTVEISGQRFVGTTGWFPLQNDNWFYEKFLNDFRMIRGYKKWIYEQHNKSREFLLSNVRDSDVVITHHAPTSLSVSSYYKGNQLNRFYVSEFYDVIEKNKPFLWIHGHTHNTNIYTIDNTRVISNPRGYPGERTGYNPNVFVQVHKKEISDDNRNLQTEEPS